MGPTAETFAEMMTREALEALDFGWGEAYEIKVAGDGEWRARRRDGKGGCLEAATPDGLRQMIADDYAMRPVPRSTGAVSGCVS